MSHAKSLFRLFYLYLVVVFHKFTSVIANAVNVFYSIREVYSKLTQINKKPKKNRKTKKSIQPNRKTKLQNKKEKQQINKRKDEDAIELLL